jgi:hypothetical protein
MVQAATGSPTGAVPAPPLSRPNPGPQVRVDLKLVPAAAVELGHPLLADGRRAGEAFLGSGDRRIVGIGDQRIGGRP